MTYEFAKYPDGTLGVFSNIGKWNLKEQIKCAEEVQHELERTYR